MFIASLTRYCNVTLKSVQAFKLVFFSPTNVIQNYYDQGSNARKVKQLCILCVHIETSSLWAEFVNKNRCLSVRLVSEEVKSIKFYNFPCMIILTMTKFVSYAYI